jgi:hypothetical protein
VPPLATRPSGSTASARTPPAGPVSTAWHPPPTAASHTRTVASSPPETSRPSGSTGGTEHPGRVAREHARGRPPGRVPQPHLAVARSGREQPATSHGCQALHRVHMTREGAHAQGAPGGRSLWGRAARIMRGAKGGVSVRASGGKERERC